MVAQLISLRWALFVNGFRRNTWQFVGAIVGALYMLLVLALVGVGFTALGLEEPELASGLAVIGSALVVLGWLVIPVFFTGTDGSMDPQRFALFPLPSRTLAVGLLLAGFIGVPGLATLLFLLLSSLAYLGMPLVLALSVLGAVGSALVAQLLARWGTALATTMAERRGVREAASVVLFLPLILLGPAINAFAENLETVGRVFHDVAAWVRFTPFGAFAGLAASAAEGRTGAALLCLAIGLASLGLLVWAYSATLRRAIVTPPRIKAGAGIKGLGWIGRFPATPTGAVAGRALSYWFKDPRYAASVAMVPVLILLFAVVLPRVADTPSGLSYLVGPLIGAVMGFSISADISYDSTAFALHVLTGVRGRADRWGRVLALMCIGVPFTLIAAVVPVAVGGEWWLLPATLGAGFGALLTSAGLASVASARWTYAVPLPGESPFKTPQGSGMRMALTQSALMIGIAVLCAPTLLGYVVAVLTSSALWSWLTLPVGFVLGGVLLWLGVRIGGRWMDSRGPELMQSVTLNR